MRGGHAPLDFLDDRREVRMLGLGHRYAESTRREDYAHLPQLHRNAWVTTRGDVSGHDGNMESRERAGWAEVRGERVHTDEREGTGHLQHMRHPYKPLNVDLARDVVKKRIPSEVRQGGEKDGGGEMNSHLKVRPALVEEGRVCMIGEELELFPR